MVEHKTTDPYGEVKGGEVRLTCHLKQIEITPQISANVHTVSLNIFSKRSVLPNQTTFTLDDGDLTKHDHSDLHFVPLVNIGPILRGETAHVVGIVIRPTKQRKGQFKRIGYMRIEGPSSAETLCSVNIPTWAERQQMRAAEGLASEDALEYESKDLNFGVCIYVITII